MFYVEIQFANTTRSSMFVDRESAFDYADELLDMFQGEEMWFDNERKTYVVTALDLEIVS